MSPTASNLRAVGEPQGTPASAALPARHAIRISELEKSFGKLVAIDRVSLTIDPGEFFMIVGPSGCGKTTLLRILAGLETATSGTIEIDTVEGATRPQNSMVFQGESIFPWMTVWNNAAYGLRMRNAPAAIIKERVGHYLERTGLSRFAGYYPHQLSGGMKQRVSIARAFANDPEILLMDEPSRRSMRKTSCYYRKSFCASGTSKRKPSYSSPTASTRRSISATVSWS